MRLYHLPSGSVVEKENEFFNLVGVPSWDELVNRDDLHAFLKNEDIQSFDSRDSANGLGPCE